MQSSTSHSKLFKTCFLVLAIGLVGCKDKKKNAESNNEQAIALKDIQTTNLPFTFQIPASWKPERIELTPMPEPPPATEGTPTVKLSGRLLFAAKGEAKNRVPPRIEIFHDPFLPEGTTATDYLNAQRQSNEDAIREKREESESSIRHVEAERSRREGRPSYHVRDEWDFAMGAEKTTISQESLLVIDIEDSQLHGYTIVLTMLKDDLPALKKAISKMFRSLRFPDG